MDAKSISGADPSICLIQSPEITNLPENGEDCLPLLEKTSMNSSPSIAELMVDCIPEGIVGMSKRVSESANQVFMKYFKFHELPDHLKDNFYIFSGYRAHYNFSQCFKSIFAIHNETGIHFFNSTILIIPFLLPLLLTSFRQYMDSFNWGHYI